MQAWERLNALGAQMYPELSARLKEQTKIDNGYLVSGGLEVIADDTDRQLDEWRASDMEYEELTDPELHQRFPTLAPSFHQAYYHPGMAQVRNPRHLKALLAACQLRDVKMSPNCQVQRFVFEGSRVVGVETTQGRLTADRYLLAGGAWTDGLLEPLGWRPAIRPIRGQIALLHPDRSPIRSLILSGKRYMVPRLDGRILVGSTEEDVGFDARTTATAIADLLELSETLVPALAAAPLERCWAGLRPGSVDGLPYLGRIPNYDNCYVAAGHFRRGIQTSPPTGLFMTEFMLGQSDGKVLEPFRLDR
jgi:glycine oxidase